MFEWKDKSDEQIVKFLMADHERLVERRRPWEDLWTLENKVFRPRRTDLLRNQPKGKRFGAEVFSGRPALAMRKFNTGLIGYMAGKKDPWLQFAPGRISLSEDDDIRDYCQNSAEQILWGFNHSTFYASLPQCGEDACISHGVMVPEIDEDTGKLIFQTIHPGESYLEIDALQRPIVYHRDFKLTALAAFEKFGAEALGGAEARIVKHAKGATAGDNPFKEYDFVYCVYKNAEYDDRAVNSLNEKYICFYVQKGGVTGRGVSGKGRLVQKIGRRWFPIVYRQMAETGCAYGTGLAADALTAALVGNKLAEKKLLAAHMAVEGRTKASKGLRNKIRLNPGSITYLNDPNDVLEIMNERINWPISDAEADNLANEMDQWFFNDLFEMLIGREKLPDTAFLTAQMKGEKVVLLGPIIGSFEDDALEPSVEVVWDNEQNNVVRRYGSYGRMPDPPQRLLDEGGGRIENYYVGQLAQIQRSIMMAEPIRQSLDFIDRFAEKFPESLLIVKAKKMLEDAMRATGLRQDLIYNEREVAQREQMLAEQKIREEQAETLERAANVVPHISKNVEPDSVLAAAGAAAG